MERALFDYLLLHARALSQQFVIASHTASRNATAAAGKPTTPTHNSQPHNSETKLEQEIERKSRRMSADNNTFEPNAAF